MAAFGDAPGSGRGEIGGNLPATSARRGLRSRQQSFAQIPFTPPARTQGHTFMLA